MDKKFLIFICINLLGSFLQGYYLIYFNGCSYHVINFLKIPEKFQSSNTTQLITLLPFGAIGGCILSINLIKIYTKRQLIIIIDILAIVSSILLITGSLNLFRLGRVIQGIYLGLSSFLTVKYVADYCTNTNIKFTMILSSIYFSLGLLVGSILSIPMPLNYEENNVVFKFIITIPIMVSTIKLLFTIVLYKHEIPSDPLKINQSYLNKELQNIYKNQDEIFNLINSKKQNKDVSYQQSLSVNKQISKLSYFCIFMMIIQNLAGANAISFYTNTMFYQHYPDPMAIRYLSTGYILFGCTATLLTTITINLLGYKKSLTYGFVAESIVLITLSILSQLHESNNQLINPQYIRILSCFFILIYNFVFSLTLGPCPWSICGSYLQDLDMIYVALSSWISTTVISMIFPYMQQTFGMPFCFAIFSLFCLIGYFAVDKFYDEKKMK